MYGLSTFIVFVVKEKKAGWGLKNVLLQTGELIREDVWYIYSKPDVFVVRQNVGTMASLENKEKL